MKYRYAEFIDNGRGKAPKNGEIYYVGTPTEELIEELGLEVRARYYDGSGHLYVTTIQRMGELGWELKFVNPCGIFLEKGRDMGGPVKLNYIFCKVEEDA